MARPNEIPPASGSRHDWDVVDAQVHFSRDQVRPALLAMDALGIRSCLVGEYWGNRADGTSMPGYLLPNGALRSLAPSLGAAAMTHPDRFSYFLRVDHRDPGLEHVVDAVAGAPGGRGLRIVIFGHETEKQAAFRAGEYTPVFAAAARHGLPVFVLHPGHAADVADYARQHPEVTVVLDHTGMPHPDADGHPDPAAFEPIEAAAEARNLALKWSHAPMIFGARAYPFPEVTPFLRRAVEAFGASRIMWGSDITMNTSGHSWAELLFAIRGSDALDEQEKRLILGGTARHLLDWPYTSPTPGWTDGP